MGGGYNYRSASTCLLCQLLECVGVLHALGTKTSAQDGPELAGDSGVELGATQRLDKRLESKSKLTSMVHGGIDCLTWRGGQKSSLGAFWL